jgi:hypothetical protein
VTIAFFASNCKKAGATERYKYIEELMNLIKVQSIMCLLLMLFYFKIKNAFCEVEQM